MLNLPRWEPSDPCDEWYLAGHLVGAVHDRLLTRGVGRGGGALGAAQRGRGGWKRGAKTADEGILPSSRAARREAMRQQGIPTSQQPVAQGNTPGGRYYEYEIPRPGGGRGRAVVTEHEDERHGPHWEAGIKKPGSTDPWGRPRHYNRDPVTKRPKSRVPFQR